MCVSGAAPFKFLRIATGGQKLFVKFVVGLGIGWRGRARFLDAQLDQQEHDG